MSITNRIKHLFFAMAEIEIDGKKFYASPAFEVGAEVFDDNFNPLPTGEYGVFVVEDGKIVEIKPEVPAEVEVEPVETVEEMGCASKKKLEEVPIDEVVEEPVDETVIDVPDHIEEVKVAVQVLAEAVDELKNQVIALDSRISDIEKAPAEAVPSESFHKVTTDRLSEAISAIRKVR